MNCIGEWCFGDLHHFCCAFRVTRLLKFIKSTISNTNMSRDVAAQTRCQPLQTKELCRPTWHLLLSVSRFKGAVKRPVASLGAPKYTVGFGGNKQVHNSWQADRYSKKPDRTLGPKMYFCFTTPYCLLRLCSFGRHALGWI